MYILYLQISHKPFRTRILTNSLKSVRVFLSVLLERSQIVYLLLTALRVYSFSIADGLKLRYRGILDFQNSHKPLLLLGIHIR